MSYEQSAKLPFNPVEDWSETPFTPRKDNMLATEAGRLIEHVRNALDHDLGAATRAAGDLATLLGGHLCELPRVAPTRGGLAPWQKLKVETYIETMICEAIPLEALAKLTSLSVSHFCRAFKDSFGLPPHAYIIRMRVERAKALMMATSEPLGQISAACGLADQAHLTRLFRSVTGTTPAVWRRMHLAAGGAKPASAVAKSLDQGSPQAETV